MIIDKIYVSYSRPSTTNILWVKPLANGEFALYAFLKGRWSLLRIMKSGGTSSPDDDTPEEMDDILGDILGIDAEGIAELKALVEDKDLLTGILPELKKKANLDSDNVFTGKATFQDKNQRYKIIIKDGEVISPAPSQEEGLSVRLSDAELRFYNNDSSYGDCQVAVNYSSYHGNKHLSVNTKIGNAYDEETLAYLSDIPAVTPQVQSDWNETDNTKKSFINNKPAIPTKTSDLTNDSGFLTAHQDISDKANKIIVPGDVHILPKVASDTSVIVSSGPWFKKDGEWYLYNKHNGIYFTTNYEGTLEFTMRAMDNNNIAGRVYINDILYYEQLISDIVCTTSIPVSVNDSIRLDIVNGSAAMREWYIESLSITEPSSTKDLSDVEEEIPTKTSDLTNDSGFLTQHQDITGKADKVSNAINGNFAALDSNGNLIDSGHKHSDYLTQHQDLSNYVQKSQTTGLLKNDGTVDTTQYLSQHQDISGKEDITPIEAVASGTTTITAQVNKYYEVAGTVSSLTVTLPTPTVNTEVTMVVVHLTVGANPTVVVTSVNEIVRFSAAYSVVANKEYELSCLYNGSKWIVSSMEVAV